jgi:hypothetical protein
VSLFPLTVVRGLHLVLLPVKPVLKLHARVQIFHPALAQGLGPVEVPVMYRDEMKTEDGGVMGY